VLCCGGEPTGGMERRVEVARIPRHFHFVFGLREQTEPFHVVHYLCLASCLRINRPERVSLYYHHEPYGPYWDLIKDELELEQVPLNEQVSRASYAGRGTWARANRHAHHADFVRMEKLLEHGGVYADMDTLFLAPLPPNLFEQPFVLGREDGDVDETGRHRPSLCNAVILSEPDAAFGRIWYERMAEAFDGSWTGHSCRLAQALSVAHPALIHIEPSTSFYPYTWTPAGLHALLEECHREWPRAYSVHLWSHLWWSPARRDFSHFSGDLLTEDFIRRTDTTYTLAARGFLPERQLGPGAPAGS
jgi:hypothetical protein